MLKKEFNKKDVNRARNLITGRVGDSSEIQIGYKKKIIEYKEGDVWTENRKTWTIKNGIKQTISKLDAIKKEIFMPLCCPSCGNVMKKNIDKPNYRIHKKCHNCVIEFEHRLDLKGNLEKYHKALKAKNHLEYLSEIESYLLDAVNTSNNSFVSEDGVVEKWVGGINKQKITKEIKKLVNKNRKKLLKEIKDEKPNIK